MDLKLRLETAPHGERGSIIDAAADFLGVAKMTIYRNLKKVGYDCGRKQRSDKGDSQISDDELRMVAALVRSSERANDKSLLPIKVAIEIAFENGQINALYHEATIARLLRERGLSPRQMKQATPHVNLKTEHPNQLWQIDPSICVLYYLKNGEGMAVMDKDKFYQNKMENLYKIANERVFRYVVTDHASGAFYCKYYQARGENQETLFDFLMTAMGEKDKQKNPFEGIPQMLYWDKGSANQAYMIRNLLDQLGVAHSAHMAGNSRAKGQVEKTNDIIERHFEGRLYLLKVNSIEELNRHCEYWQRDFQSNPRYAHTRHGMPRFTAWRKIQPDQLIARPPIEVCKMLLSSKAEQREVKGNYQIAYNGERYSLSEVDNIAIGEKVTVAVNPYAYPNIRVTHDNRFGEAVTYDIPPLAVDEFGFTSDAVLADAMTGGHHHQAPLTQVDKNRQDIDELAYGTRDEQEIDKLRNSRGKSTATVAFDGKIDPMGYLAKRDEANTAVRIPKRGKPLDVGEPALQNITPPKAPGFDNVQRDEPVLPVLDFIKWYAKHHNITPEINAKIRQQYADGIKESDYDAVAAALRETKLVKVG